MRSRKWRRAIALAAGGAVAALSCACIGINVFISTSTNDSVMGLAQASQAGADAVVVLGARVYANGNPSPILEDRLHTGLDLMEAEAAPVIVVSGDNSAQANYQVDAMAQWLVSHGVNESAIVRDDQGISTYDTMWRARHEYRYSSVIAVSQDFHLARIIWDGERQGLEVTAVRADRQEYEKAVQWRAREWLVRTKDFVMGFVRPDAGVVDL